MISERLQAMIMRHEGFKSKIYLDHLGHRTIGYGTNLEVGLTEQQAKALLLIHLAQIETELIEALDFYDDIDAARQDVLLNMAYQMGIAGVQKFKQMIVAVRAQDWDRAALEMLDSLWANQTPSRADELSRMMQRGKYTHEPEGANDDEEKER